MRSFYINLIFHEVTEVLLPGLIIYFLLQAFLTPPPDLAKTLFTISAATLAVLLAATTFIYNQFNARVDDALMRAASIRLDRNKSLTDEERKKLNLVLSDIFAPKLLSQIVIRLLILILISSVVSAIDYFGSTTNGIFIASTAMILFVATLAYLIFRSLSDLLGKVLVAEERAYTLRNETPKILIVQIVLTIVLIMFVVGLLVFLQKI